MAEATCGPNPDKQILDVLVGLITKISMHLKNRGGCLLVEAGEHDQQQASEVLTSLMYKLIEEGFSAPGDQGPAIAIVNTSSAEAMIESNYLLSMIQGRINLSKEPLAALKLSLERNVRT